MTTEAQELFGEPESLADLLTGINQVPGIEDGFGLGLTLSVFIVSFYKLSDAGFVAAYTAASFTSTILAFLLAGIGLMPVELPFLAASASLAGLGYMYIKGRV